MAEAVQGAILLAIIVGAFGAMLQALGPNQ